MAGPVKGPAGEFARSVIVHTSTLDPLWVQPYLLQLHLNALKTDFPSSRGACALQVPGEGLPDAPRGMRAPAAPWRGVGPAH